MGLGRAVSSPRPHNNDDYEAAHDHHRCCDDNDDNSIDNDNQLKFIEFIVEFVQLDFIQLVEFVVQFVVNNQRSPVIVTGRPRYDSSSATHTEIP